MFHSAQGKMNVTTGSQGRFYNCSDKWSRGKRRKTQLTQWGIAATSWGEPGIWLGKPGRDKRLSWQRS